MKKLKGKRVLITGGAGGIGLCTAEEFAKAGAEPIITDINENALAQAADKLRAFHVAVHTRRVDVTDRAQVEALAYWVNDDLGGLDILINNAGIGHSGELIDTTIDDWERLIKVNLCGPLYHVYAFLPAMIARGGGQIVNISSGQAFFRLPTWGAYATIKLALGAFSEILHWEVKKHNVRVTTVYPFMVNTSFYKDISGETLGQKLSMKLVPYYSMTPEKVGKIIFQATKKEKQIEMVSLINDFGFYSRLVPPLADFMSWTSNLFLTAGGKKSKQGA